MPDRKTILRPLADTDLDRTLRWLNDPDIARRIGVKTPVTKEGQEAWFADLTRRQDKFVFAICLGEDGRHVGNVSLDTVDQRHRTARLSIFIGDDSLRGAGLGTEALGLLLDFAFEDLDLNRVWCKVTDDDENLSAFYEKSGFEVEGKLRQHEYIDGRFVDKVILGILRDTR